MLYAPWRSKYVSSLKKTKENECVFCSQLEKDLDAKFYILKRFKHHAVFLNRHPYNAGHLLIISLRHVPTINKLEKEERIELIELTNFCINALENTIKPHGINVGINIGAAAGAGLPEHLHTHVLPRWKSDTNFLPVLGKTRQISFDLNQLYEMLEPEFNNIQL